MGYNNRLFGFNSSFFYRELLPAFKEGLSNEMIKEEVEFGLERGIYTKAIIDYTRVINYVDYTFLTISPTSNVFNKYFLEQVKTLFENLIIKYCLESMYHVGRKYPMSLLLNIGNTELPMRYLLHKLDVGAFSWNRDGMDGITGWVNKEELELLLKGVEDYYDLPLQIDKKPNKQLFLFFKKCLQDGVGILSGNSLFLETLPPPEQDKVYNMTMSNKSRSDYAFLFDLSEGLCCMNSG